MAVYCNLTAYEVANSMNVTNNTTNIYVKLTYTSNSTSHNFNNPPGNININGTNHSFNHNINYNTTETLYEETITIPHESNGSKTVYISYNFDTGISAGNITGEQWVTLSNIPRASSVSCTDGVFGGNITININKASNDFRHTVYMNFKGTTYPIREKTTDSSITYTIPSNLAAQIPNENSAVATIYCETYNGDTHVGTNTCDITLRVDSTSSGVTLSVTLTDINSITTSITGNSNKIIKRMSTLQVSVNATISSGASVSKIKIINNGIEYTGNNVSSYTNSFAGVLDRAVTIQVTDSRGNTTSNIYMVNSSNWIDYDPPSFNIPMIQRTSSTSNEVTHTVSGTWFQGSFGNYDNTLSLKYRYRQVGGSWSSSYTLSPDKIGGTFQSSGYLSGSFNHNYSYEFEFTATDRFGDDIITYSLGQGKPIIDIGKNDVAINGDSNVSGNMDVGGDFTINRSNFLDLVYPVGSIYISTSSTNPKNLFGGNWEQIKGRFLIGAGTPSNNTTNWWGNLLTGDETASSSSKYSMPAGEMGGSSYYKLESRHLPQHEHSFIDDNGRYHNPTVDREHETDWGASFTSSNDYKIANAGSQRMSGDSDKPHPNMPPYLVVYMWKRLADTGSYSVTSFGSGYGFSMNSNGYYESLNKGVDNSWAMCKVAITTSKTSTVTISYINYAESNYDYGLFSNLDTNLSDDTSDSTNVYKSCKGESVNSVKTLTYTVTSGSHFITIKYRKDSSQSSNNDSLQFKIAIS